MVIRAFPPIESSDENGLLAIGGDVDIESLLLAYKSGIFPWPLHEKMLAWFSPPERTLLFLDKVRVSKSLLRERRRSSWSFSFDKNFRQVILACSSSKRPGQRGTWITPSIVDAYCNLHESGYAHSVECYEGDELVGGLYGISIGGMFAGESMFYKKPNASKLSLLTLIDHLSEQNVPWIDCQQMTPLLKSFGAESLDREDFMELLRISLEKKPILF